MKTTLYCIHCSKTVLAETDFAGRMFHYNTVQVNNSPDPGVRYDLEACEMKGGYAACPPPEYDLEGYIVEHGLPPSPVNEFCGDLEEVYPLWVFDPNTEHMVMEDRVS